MTTKRGRPPHDDILTPREWEVLALIEEGLTNEQIAERLGISFGGAKFHVAEILSKLNVSSREDAVRVAWSHHRRPVGVAGLLARMPRPPALWRRSPWTIAGGGVAAALVLLLAIFAVNQLVFTDSVSQPSDEELGRAAADFEAGPEDEQTTAAAEFDPEDCVTGEAARNPRVQRMGGELVTPTNETFSSVEEAEHWLCMPIPRPRIDDLAYRDLYTQGSPPQPVMAQRAHDLSTYLDEEGPAGGRSVNLSYLIEELELPIELRVQKGGLGHIEGFEMAQSVQVQGTEALLFANLPNVPHALLAWEKDDYSFMLDTRLTDDFTVDDLLDLAESIR